MSNLVTTISQTLGTLKRCRNLSVLLLIFLLSILATASTTQAQSPDTRPNIVLLLADDMGYTDLAMFGGEAQTPNLDSLAQAGVTFTNFHVLPSCTPTRAALLSGVDNHLNGVGTMPNQLAIPGNQQVGQPGYETYLNDRVVTVATLLQDNGYHTYMAGKWDLGKESETARGEIIWDEGYWPIDRGFEKSYGVLDGGSQKLGHIENRAGKIITFFEDDERVIPDGRSFYTTEKYTSKIIEYIDEGRTEDAGTRKPFFAFWSITTPHFPLQVPMTYTNQYLNNNTYNVGWDAIKDQRIARMKTLGLISDTLEIPERWATVPAWDDESDPNWSSILNTVQAYPEVWGTIPDVATLKQLLAREMAIYMAEIDYMDDQIGRLIQHLKDIGEYDNTIFVFMSDNGPDNQYWELSRPAWLNWMARVGIDNSLENIGYQNSWFSYGHWALASSGPLVGVKVEVAEGGVRAPMIVAYPGGNLNAGTTTDAFSTVYDIVPTILEYANINHSMIDKPNKDACTVSYKDKTVCPINGRSLKALWEGSATTVYGPDDPIGFELFGLGYNQALYMGDWKILRLEQAPGYPSSTNGQWRLFNIKNEMSEQTDLAAANPERLQMMIAAYEEYETNVGFVDSGLVQHATPTRSIYIPIVIRDAIIASFLD